MIEIDVAQIEEVNFETHRYETDLAGNAKYNQEIRILWPDGSSSSVWVGKKVGATRYAIHNQPLARKDGSPFLVL